MAGAVSFEYCESDHAQAHTAYYLRKLRSAKTLSRIAIVLFGLWFILWAYIYYDTGSASYALQYILKPSVFGIILFLILWIASVLHVKRSLQRQYHQSRALRGPIDFSWTDSGTEYRTILTSANLAWGDFYGWVRIKFGYMLFVTENSSYLIPRRVLSEEADRDLERTLRANKVRQLV